MDSVFSRLEKIDQMQVCFVAGFVKSGTTWVERILDSHPDIVCKGEAHFGSLLTPAIRNCISLYNAKIPKKGNWSRLHNEMPETHHETNYRFAESDLKFILGESMRLMFAKWIDKDGPRVIGDKSPDNLLHMSILDEIFPESRFVYVVRDVRDVIVSGWFFNLNVNPSQTLEKYSSIHDYAIHVSASWRRQVSEQLSTRLILGERFHELRYEDIVENPFAALRGIFEHLSVDSSEQVIARVADATRFKRFSGGRDEGDENRQSFYRKGVVGDWRNHFTDETEAIVRSECGALLKSLGYTV